MAVFKILLTVAMIAVMVYLMAKRYNGPMVLLSLGLITLGFITLISGSSVMGDNTVGNNFVDLFEFVKTKFAANLTGSILQVMCIFGYIAFMNAIKAADMLALTVSKPLARVRNKTVIVIGAMLICVLIKIVLASQSSTAALLVVILYPIMRACGVSKETAAASIVIGTTIDIGPSEANTAIFIGDGFVGANASVPEFFTEYQIICGLVSTVVVIALFVLINNYFDKKSAVEQDIEDSGGAIAKYQEKLKGTPKIYAVFPLLPIILLLIFSFSNAVELSAPAVNILCFALVFVVHLLLNFKNFRESFNLSNSFFEGMGKAMFTLGCLIGTSTVFSAGLTQIGGTTALLEAASKSNFGGALSLFIVAFLAMFIAFACGTGTPAMTTVLSIMPTLVDSIGLGALTIAAPVIMAGGYGRALCFVAPAALICSAFSGVEVQKLVKRNAVPALGGTIAAVAASMLFCA